MCVCVVCVLCVWFVVLDVVGICCFGFVCWCLGVRICFLLFLMHITLMFGLGLCLCWLWFDLCCRVGGDVCDLLAALLDGLWSCLVCCMVVFGWGGCLFVVI